MKLIRFTLAKLRLLHLILVVFTCAFMYCQVTLPALAITSYQSDPTEGTTQLLETQRRTDEVSRSAPLNRQEVTDANRGRGLNEVQGDADIDKMQNPENSQSSRSFKDEVESLLQKATGN
jgi:hypothetical protein